MRDQSFQTERIVIRPLVESDCDSFCILEADSGVKRYLGGSKRHSGVEYLQSLPLWRREPLNVMAISLRGSDQFIGRCGLKMKWPGERELEIVLTKDSWDKGFATEIGKRLLEVAFNDSDVEGVVGVVHPENEGSIKVLKKLGMSLTAHFIDSTYPNHLVYRVGKDQYAT